MHTAVLEPPIHSAAPMPPCWSSPKTAGEQPSHTAVLKMLAPRNRALQRAAVEPRCQVFQRVVALVGQRVQSSCALSGWSAEPRAANRRGAGPSAVRTRSRGTTTMRGSAHVSGKLHTAAACPGAGLRASGTPRM